MSFSAVGTVFDPQAFKAHIATLDLSWAKSITIHHTGSPTLEQRPKGWTIQHMRNLQHFYQNEKGWKTGPHLFTDEDQVFGLTPLTMPGTHAQSFNRNSIGIEMLGNYDAGQDNPHQGRGLEVVENTARITAMLLKRMNLRPSTETIKFHRDDPRTTKTCPGTQINKTAFIAQVHNRSYEPPAKGPIPEPLTLESLDARLRKLESSFAASNFP